MDSRTAWTEKLGPGTNRFWRVDPWFEIYRVLNGKVKSLPVQQLNSIRSYCKSLFQTFIRIRKQF